MQVTRSEWGVIACVKAVFPFLVPWDPDVEGLPTFLNVDTIKLAIYSRRIREGRTNTDFGNGSPAFTCELTSVKGGEFGVRSRNEIYSNITYGSIFDECSLQWIAPNQTRAFGGITSMWILEPYINDPISYPKRKFITLKSRECTGERCPQCVVMRAIGWKCSRSLIQDWYPELFDLTSKVMSAQEVCNSDGGVDSFLYAQRRWSSRRQP